MSQFQGENHAQHNNNLTSSEDDENIIICEQIATCASVILLILTFPVSIFFCVNVVTEYERAVIFRLGRVRTGARGPGLIFVLPCVDDVTVVDLRTTSFDVEPQEILTRDAVSIKLDAVVFFRLRDPLLAVIKISNFRESTMLLGQTTLRNVAGTRRLNELLTEKDEIAHVMQQILDEATDPWGVKVERVEIKDVRLPHEMQRAMAAEAEANREARAKIVAADGEKNAADALNQAADIISKNPTALQLRYLQTLHSISGERNSTIIFPFPIELFAGIAKK